MLRLVSCLYIMKIWRLRPIELPSRLEFSSFGQRSIMYFLFGVDETKSQLSFPSLKNDI